jgi:hypothetical protein
MKRTFCYLSAPRASLTPGKVVVEIDIPCVVMGHTMHKKRMLCFEQIQFKRPSLSQWIHWMRVTSVINVMKENLINLFSSKCARIELGRCNWIHSINWCCWLDMTLPTTSCVHLFEGDHCSRCFGEPTSQTLLTVFWIRSEWWAKNTFYAFLWYILVILLGSQGH